jgi:hypothetical protein
MKSRTTLLGPIAALSLLATSACAVPADDGVGAEEPAPLASGNLAGSDLVTGAFSGAGGSSGGSGAGGAGGDAGAAGSPAVGGNGGGGATGMPGLEGEWSFEDLGSTSTKDESGNGHHGVLVGSGVKIVNGGKVGAAASFSGGDGRISVASDSALDFTSAATIELWVKLSGFTTGAIVARAGANGDGVRVRTSQGNVQVSFTRASYGSAIVTSDPSVLSTSWTHVAVVNDGSTLKLYLNGKLHRTETGGQLGYVSGELFVGKSGSDSALNGYVDELKWWSVARTPEEVCSDAGGTFAAGDCTL